MKNAAAVFFLTLVLSGQETPVTWHNLSKLEVEGKGWTDTKHPYDRLPAAAEGVVRAPVWSLSQDSTGMRYRFVTDADSIKARWKLRRSRLAMNHMAATGVSGLDLYVRTGNAWHWLGVGRPEKQENEGTLVSGLKRARREYMLYLPLYNGIDSVEIGLSAGTALEPAPPSAAKPVVFYGTSIVQGGCAARPGMAYPEIVGRMLDTSTVNLGFSGNGKMEPEMAKLLASLDPSVYVIDSLPNLDVAEAQQRVEPFITTIRAAHPKTPLVLIEHVTYSNAPFLEARAVKVNGTNAVLKKVYEKLKAAGDKRVFYISTNKLYPGDGEDTVDGSHPTDLGFWRMAQTIGPVVRQALQSAR